MAKENRLGSKIRQLRQARELSVADLAEQSQSSIEFIEGLEAGQLAPSLAPLLKIARGLGVRLGTFLDDEPQSGPVIVRSGRSEKIVRFSGTSPASRASVMDFYSLASDKKDRHIEPFIIDVHPSLSKDYTPSFHEGEEFIYVLAGEIEVCYGKEHYKLNAGDSIYYDSIVPHDVHALGNANARILAVVYAPF